MDFKKFSSLILFEQTLFALPFAYLGVLFANGRHFSTWVLVTVAFVAARTAGMSFNRVIDAEIDSRNPRTKHRLVPSGEVKRIEVWLIGLIACLMLVGASFLLNTLCFYLSFPAIILLFTYSYFKRFSSSSHFYLGLVEAVAPIGGYIAVTGKFSLVSILLGVAILLWIAGLDIVYAVQDLDFDRKEGLYSFPSIFGQNASLIVSEACYVLSMCAMVTAGVITGKSIPYWMALACVAFIFIYQQMVVKSGDMSLALKKFFYANLYVSPFLLIGTLIDVFLT
ncbi:MAG: putative 4-hydroxybenzoate polyprenyltransferase [Deltaproteobacteria bacterium]|nr:putative 4-hydroxybenzoate polyprenyltransferase [Deltaproteobacteria bacterium]